MRVPVLAMPDSSRDLSLERQVEACFRCLEHGPLLFGVQQVLKSAGFRDVVITGNTHWRGRSRLGGFNIRCRLSTPTGRLLTLVQVKALPDANVQRRFVDELRSTMLRYGAPLGLIISNGEFSRAAIHGALMFPDQPVKLLNGRRLARLAIKNCVGVRIKPLGLPSLPELVVDHLFFDRLEETADR